MNSPRMAGCKAEHCTPGFMFQVGTGSGRAIVFSPTLYHCNKRFGGSVSEATARPNPTMRLEFSGPSLESLNGKRQSFLESGPENSKRIVARGDAVILTVMDCH